MATTHPPLAATTLGVALVVLLLATAPATTAGLSTLTLYEGPGCSGAATTYQCGYHRIPLGGGWKFVYDKGYALLVLRYPGRTTSRALLSPITTRYAEDAGNCHVPDTQYAQLSC